jgi:tetratricopeptide (TPR) repeat protein
MNTRFIWSITFGLFLLVGTRAEAGARQQATNDNVAEAHIALNEGIQAYRKDQIDLAIQDFKKAKELDHSLVNASLYLATAYSAQFIPGDTSASNLQNGSLAVEEFKEILTEHPDNVSAIDGVGAMLYNLAGTPFNAEKMEESKSFHKRHVDLRPQDPEPYYWIGVIDWSLAYRGNRAMRETNRVAYRDPMPSRLAEQFGKRYGDIVEDGMTKLRRDRPTTELRRRDGLSKFAVPAESRYADRSNRPRRQHQNRGRSGGPGQSRHGEKCRSRNGT